MLRKIIAPLLVTGLASSLFLFASPPASAAGDCESSVGAKNAEVGVNVTITGCADTSAPVDGKYKPPPSDPEGNPVTRRDDVPTVTWESSGAVTIWVDEPNKTASLPYGATGNFDQRRNRH